ncbi:MAG: polyprenyl diphosphate synthase [archaeon]
MAKTIPRHIAIIPDGNRRHAKKKGKAAFEGHRLGSDKFREALKWCKEAGIKEVTFWAASSDNLKRDRKEVDFLITLFHQVCDEFLKEYTDKKDKVMIRFIGDLSSLPKQLHDKMDRIMGLTKDYTDYKLNLLVAYGGEWELALAAKKIADKVKQGLLKPEEITPEVFEKHLELQSKPDLVIRTSQQRTSGLLPFQIAYSEIIFLEKILWPDFSKKDFDWCLKEYSTRIRTYGR